jgi:CRISPR system Cascade subunit CasA
VSDHPHSFNLIDEPWLPCLDRRGQQVTCSLRTVLRRAHELRDLVVDTPTQYPPIIRLLLSILHRAAAGPVTEEMWTQLWNEGRFPDVLDEYLDRVAERFDLFHPAMPFMQVAGLTAQNGETKTVAQLIPYLASGNNVPLFSAARDDQPPALTPAEAARWLLHAHAWDTAAIKTGATGDPKARGGKTTGNPPGYLGELGVVVPVGKTLFETLELNLVRGGYGDEDLPPWERDPDGPEWTERPPRGRVDLYTWQSRRIRLIPELTADGVRVRRCVVTAGDRVVLHLVDQIETHSAFRRSENKEKQLKLARVYLPHVHDPAKKLWRGLGAILADTRADDGRMRPLVLTQLGEPLWLDLLREAPVRLRGVGISYGNQRAVVDEVYDDEIPLPVLLLAEQGREWYDAVLRGVALVEEAARAVGRLAANLARAAGSRDQAGGYDQRARERFYATLDLPFRRWLEHLRRPDGSPEELLSSWADQVKRYADELADDLLRAAPPVAVAGRPDPQGKNGEWLSSAIAEKYYRHAVRVAVTRVAPRATDSLESTVDIEVT